MSLEISLRILGNPLSPHGATMKLNIFGENLDSCACVSREIRQLWKCVPSTTRLLRTVSSAVAREHCLSILGSPLAPPGAPMKLLNFFGENLDSLHSCACVSREIRQLWKCVPSTTRLPRTVSRRTRNWLAGRSRTTSLRKEARQSTLKLVRAWASNYLLDGRTC